MCLCSQEQLVDIRIDWVRERMEQDGYKLATFVRHPFERYPVPFLGKNYEDISLLYYSMCNAKGANLLAHFQG